MISIQSGWEDILAIIKVFFAFILSFLGIIFIIYHENAIAPRFSFYADFFCGKTTLFSSRLSRPLQLFSSSQKSCSDSLWSLLSRPNIPNLHAHDIKLAPFFTQRLVSKGRTGRTDTIAQTLIQP